MTFAQTILDDSISEFTNQCAEELEKILDADVVTYHGPIHPSFFKVFRNFIESTHVQSKRKRLALFLHTGGGTVETVEKMVVLIRSLYEEVYFVVPDYAMSAGTIFCMSGDKIFMDYSSSLGPIDPQVQVGQEYVPALGYLDKVAELVQKARNRELTEAEFIILQNQDLARLRRFEQARDLSIDLLKDWLVKYKFKNWAYHRTDPSKKGKPVTPDEKKLRAQEIAQKLGDNKIWHSHGRMIGIEKLSKELKLEIDDYSQNATLKKHIRKYHDLLTDYIERSGQKFYLHSRSHNA